VCVDVVKTGWVPGNTLAIVMNTVNALMLDPNPASPLNGDAAADYKMSKEQNSRNYFQNARNHAMKIFSFDPPNWYL